MVLHGPTGRPLDYGPRHVLSVCCGCARRSGAGREAGPYPVDDDRQQPEARSCPQQSTAQPWQASETQQQERQNREQRSRAVTPTARPVRPAGDERVLQDNRLQGRRGHLRLLPQETGPAQGCDERHGHEGQEAVAKADQQSDATVERISPDERLRRSADSALKLEVDSGRPRRAGFDTGATNLQEDIMPFLSALFPNFQFIIATHSPAVISSIPNALRCRCVSISSMTTTPLGCRVWSPEVLCATSTRMVSLARSDSTAA